MYTAHGVCKRLTMFDADWAPTLSESVNTLRGAFLRARHHEGEGARVILSVERELPA